MAEPATNARQLDIDAALDKPGTRSSGPSCRASVGADDFATGEPTGRHYTQAKDMIFFIEGGKPAA